MVISTITMRVKFQCLALPGYHLLFWRNYSLFFGKIRATPQGVNVTLVIVLSLRDKKNHFKRTGFAILNNVLFQFMLWHFVSVVALRHFVWLTVDGVWSHRKQRCVVVDVDVGCNHQ